METEVCWDTRLWANTPHGRCPCLVRRQPWSITCGLRGMTKRPVYLCGQADKVRAIVEVTDAVADRQGAQ